MRIAFDIGGVISKYPNNFYYFMLSLKREGHDLFIITDMHGKEEVAKNLCDNGFSFLQDNVYCAQYDKYGEMCKAVLLKELKIDMFFDDFMGYLQWDSSFGPAPIRLLIVPDAYKPYWHESWKTPEDCDFGRRVYTKRI